MVTNRISVTNSFKALTKVRIALRADFHAERRSRRLSDVVEVGGPEESVHERTAFSVGFYIADMLARFFDDKDQFNQVIKGFICYSGKQSVRRNLAEIAKRERAGV
jgi:hypothetical protein